MYTITVQRTTVNYLDEELNYLDKELNAFS